MGQVMENYCDSCGDSVGQATLADAVQITAIGTSGTPVLIYLCVKPDFEAKDTQVSPQGQKPPKITGCARKVLTKATLARLYEDVAEYTGDTSVKPFQL